MRGVNFGGFKIKVVLPVTAVLISLTVALTAYTSAAFMSYSDVLINGKITSNANSLKSYIDDCKTFSRAAAIAMTYKPEVIKAVKNRDREALLRFLAPMRELYRVNFFTITDELGVVLLRTYEPDKYGDPITQQKNIQNAMLGEVSTYFETGTLIRVSARTGAPLYDTDGTFIGIVSAGVRFDTNELVDELKAVFQSDVTVFLGDTRIATTITRDGKRIVGTKIPPDVARVVFEEKNVFSREVDIFGVTYRSVYVPLLNPQDSAFASFFIGFPMAQLKAETDQMVRNIIAISLAGLLAALLIQYMIISTVSKPLIALSKNMDDIKNGNFDVAINTRSEDEVGYAGKALQKLVNTMRELIGGINKTISENQKGKTYHIDTSAFSGEYRLLAERIVELSEFSTKDKLTGLANRRTFDARLELECARATRDNIPLSLLMMDLDRFKRYNDAHGHRQGDAALRSVAATLTRMIKRGADLAARWGGEEFTVLLPNTDSSGAAHLADRIRAAIEATDIPDISGDAPQNMTVSIGVYTRSPKSEDMPEDLVSKADKALYHAKNTGRNRVREYGDDL